jgi:hypothetical protein
LPSNLHRRIRHLELSRRRPGTPRGQAVGNLGEPLLDYDRLSDEDLEWLEQPFEGIRNDIHSIKRHPEACAEFERRLFAMKSRLERS